MELRFWILKAKEPVWERKLTRKAALKIVGKFSDTSMLILLLFIVANVHIA